MALFKDKEFTIDRFLYIYIVQIKCIQASKLTYKRIKWPRSILESVKNRKKQLQSYNIRSRRCYMYFKGFTSKTNFKLKSSLKASEIHNYYL